LDRYTTTEYLVKPDFIVHLKQNWPLAVIIVGIILYIPIVLISGVFLTNQGKIDRVNEPTRYWRWVALFLGLLLASLAVLFGSHFLSKQ
jgi:hypothetical protein